MPSASRSRWTPGSSPILVRSDDKARVCDALARRSIGSHTHRTHTHTHSPPLLHHTTPRRSIGSHARAHTRSLLLLHHITPVCNAVIARDRLLHTFRAPDTAFGCAKMMLRFDGPFFRFERSFNHVVCPTKNAATPSRTTRRGTFWRPSRAPTTRWTGSTTTCAPRRSSTAASVWSTAPRGRRSVSPATRILARRRKCTPASFTPIN